MVKAFVANDIIDSVDKFFSPINCSTISSSRSSKLV